MTDRINALVAKALDGARVVAQEIAVHRGLDLDAVDRQVADAAYRWGLALGQELPTPRPSGAPIVEADP